MSSQPFERNRNSRKRILIFCDYYLPSTKAGGGAWTVVNLIERFSDRYDFFVVTRNHESREDTKPFTTVETGAWNQVGPARVYYLSPNNIKKNVLSLLIEEVSPHGIYLNSVFSKPVVTFLLLRRMGSYSQIPVVLAPCGELSIGSMSLKRRKKRMFLLIAKPMRLYAGLNWKASSKLESDEIRDTFGMQLHPFIAPDLPPKQILPDFDPSTKPVKVSGNAKFVFYSRIDRKKNLSFALDAFARVASVGQVEFLIVGPVQQQEYWLECEAKIRELPDTVSIAIVGAVSHEEGLKYLESNHFFILPTLGENFGYVILEAFSAGSPVLLSERTIWSDVEEKNCGWVARLDDPNRWDEIIARCIEMGQEEFMSMSRSARQNSQAWLRSPEHEQSNLNVLNEVFGD